MIQMAQPTDSPDGVGTAVYFLNVNDSFNDIQRMESILKRLGFHWKPYLNKTKKEIRHIIKKEAADVPEGSKGFLCIFDSHGDSYDAGKKKIEDVIKAKDGRVLVKTLMQDFYENASEHLANKPKVFLMQFCRGKKTPATVHVEVPADPDVVTLGLKEMNPYASAGDVYQRLPYNLPIRKDVLLHYSTVGGYYSWEDLDYGTPFLRAWCDQLDQLTKKGIPKPDIITMATAVNRKVCEEYKTSNCPDEEDNLRHQMPQIVSMFTQNFYF